MLHFKAFGSVIATIVVLGAVKAGAQESSSSPDEGEPITKGAAVQFGKSIKLISNGGKPAEATIKGETDRSRISCRVHMPYSQGNVQITGDKSWEVSQAKESKHENGCSTSFTLKSKQAPGKLISVGCDDDDTESGGDCSALRLQKILGIKVEQKFERVDDSRKQRQYAEKRGNGVT